MAEPNAAKAANSQAPAAAEPRKRLGMGELVPFFTQRCTSNEAFAFGSLGGMYYLLTFYGSMAEPLGRAAAESLLAQAEIFDDRKAALFLVSSDSADEAQKRIGPRTPGIRIFWDVDRKIADLYGAIGADGQIEPMTIVIDPSMRVMTTIPIRPDQDHGALIRRYVDQLAMPDMHAGTAIHAPVLIAPRIFELGFCRQLIEHYEQRGGHDSGFMREVDGRTVGMIDYRHKRREDAEIADESLRRGAQMRIARRLVPQIEKAFQFRVTRMERYIVACYSSDPGGYFRAHRDNTTKGTAHRRFAVTINLNADDYEGGNLRFPEFGSRLYKAPTGGAVVFSCSLLHEAMPLTRGKRYAFLPFLYDDAAAAIREQNSAFLAGNYRPYQAGKKEAGANAAVDDTGQPAPAAAKG